MKKIKTMLLSILLGATISSYGIIVQNVPVDAGILNGLPSGYVAKFDTGVLSVQTDAPQLPYAYFVLDLGYAKTFSQLHLQNRAVLNTDYNIRELKVLVGSEGAGFDPMSVASYNSEVFSGIPSPDSNLAGVSRAITLTGQVTKRYLLFKVVSSYIGAISSSNAGAQFGNITLPYPTYPVIQNVEVDAGILNGLSSGYVAKFDTGVLSVQADASQLPYAYFVLDLGCTKALSQLNLQNRAVLNTDYNIYELKVLVGSEGAGFDPMSVASYNSEVFSGIHSPDSNLAGVSRAITLTGQVTKRYLLFKVVSSYIGAISSSNAGAQFGNITLPYTIVQNVKVDAGRLSGLSTDYVAKFSPGLLGISPNIFPRPTEYRQFVLDLGSAKTVANLILQNRTDVNSLYNVRNIQVFVGSEESGFDHASDSSYTTQIFSGIPFPDSYNAGLYRTIDFQGQVTKRYFLVRVFSNYIDTFHTTEGESGAQFGDIFIPSAGVYSSVKILNGRPRLRIDDLPLFENFYVTDASSLSLDVLPSVSAANYQVAGIPIYPVRAGSQMWLGYHQYDWNPLDTHLMQARSLAPNIKIILYLCLDPYSAWVQNNPNEIVRYSDQTTLPYPSLASSVYIQEASDFLTALISHINTQAYNNQVIGIHLVGGDDGQWYHQWASAYKFADYSPAMLQYFKTFLRTKYSNLDANLQQAWGNSSITFDTVAIPTASRRLGTGDFHTPLTDQDIIDYTEAYGQVPADLIKTLSHTVKQASGGRYWVSVYDPSVMEVGYGAQASGRYMQKQLLECSDIDGMTSVTYYQRPLDQPGSTGFANGSFLNHGKLAIHEQDIRTYLDPSINSLNANVLLGWTPDWAHQSNMLIREFGLALTTGIGTWMYDMNGNWYDAPEFWNRFAKFQQIGEGELNKTFQSVADMAVVVDDFSWIYRPLAPQEDLLQYNSISLQRTPLGWMGAPYDVYLLDDLLQPSTKAYKCYLFLNTYAIDSAKVTQIHNRLAANQATAVWVYAPGIISNGTKSTSNITNLTGFPIERAVIQNSCGQVTIRNDVTHPIINGIAGQTYGTGSYNGEVYYCPQAGNGVTILGNTTVGGKGGLAVKTMNGWTSVYSSGLCFSPELLRNILSFSGGFLYVNDAATSVSANQRYLSVFAKNTGTRTLTLPQQSQLEDLLSSENLGRGSSFPIYLEEGQARIFSITP